MHMVVQASDHIPTVFTYFYINLLQHNSWVILNNILCIIVKTHQIIVEHINLLVYVLVKVCFIMQNSNIKMLVLVKNSLQSAS